MVAGQAERASLADQLGAGVGLGAVADDVAEAPDLVDLRLLDRVQAGLEGGQVGMDVGDHRDAHGGSVPGAYPGSYDDDGDRDRLDRRAALGSEPGGARPSRGRGDRSGALPRPAAEARAGGLQLQRGDAARRAAGRSARATSRHASAPSSSAISPPAAASTGSRSPAPASSTSSSPTPGTGAPWRASARPARAWGRSRPSSPQRILVEFVSANPTGPLHVGGGRHAAYGDSLARLLEAVGHDVEREYYVNDGGGQVDPLRRLARGPDDRDRAARGRLHRSPHREPRRAPEARRGSTRATPRRSAAARSSSPSRR